MGFTILIKPFTGKIITLDGIELHTTIGDIIKMLKEKSGVIVNDSGYKLVYKREL